ncbi:VIN3-like protein 2 isoform X2 [Tripterygium wilfordii]|uniref:VIN3-like protein 2 isoform X2 n=1 Tax=Tripterygium wilfordii TaxID=458696 RepID=UPI0018F816F8|nr:VIN3-like protein 2 isoform X2 [Tripterygium wilfordii]XP_038695982.1 VIN3-like protein 2 isoform X2 [Tripterygium wilfordii]
MDSSLEGVVHDPSKCSKLSMDEKRELVYEISKLSHGASEMLQSWSRQEILQILCAEMGKERKYTGLTKVKIIEHLLTIVSERKSREQEPITDLEAPSSPAAGQRASKRQRKTDHPSRFVVAVNSHPSNNNGNDLGSTTYCKNSACKATLKFEDAFCKRCSCCICYQYDDNKDPSVWLVCSSEAPFEGSSCGMSCHLECALKHDKSGIGKVEKHAGLDGSYYCVSCGKVNDLLGCWRKQLVMAKETRRVDILCYRVSLSQKLLNRSVKYQKIYGIVSEAMKKLEAELGALAGLPVKMGRGIVNRLSSGPEVQKLCALAVESLDDMLSNANLHPLPNPTIRDPNFIAPTMVRFEDVCPTSITVALGSENFSLGNDIYSLWHRKAQDLEYPAEPTCKLLEPNRRFVVEGLTPATEYHFRVVSFNGTKELDISDVKIATSRCENELPSCSVLERSQSPVTNCSSLSNPSSVEDETNNNISFSDQNDNRADNYHAYCTDTDKIISANLSNDAINSILPGGGGTPVDAASLLDEEGANGVSGSGPNSDTLKLDNRQNPGERIVEEMNADTGSDTLVAGTSTERVPFVGRSEDDLPITPFKLEKLKDVQVRNGRATSSKKGLENGTGKGEEPHNGSTSKKSGERKGEECRENGLPDSDFEYYVKVIRWLECEGHIEKNFRQKFLTWYSLRATPQELRVVKVFVDTFIEDPASLAGQLMDTFAEIVSNKRSTAVPSGLCMQLWH